LILDLTNKKTYITITKKVLLGGTVLELKIRASIVLMAPHNPIIVNQQWLKEQDLILDTPKNYINTPEFSAFESNNNH
jgi:hypothetical protein